MKSPFFLFLFVISLFISHNTISAQNQDYNEPSQKEITNDTESGYSIYTITGPNLIEVNTVNVYGFSQYSECSSPEYTYQWTLLCADDPNISPFFMGYNTGSTCSFICYEPVNLFLWLDVWRSGYAGVWGHAETMVTVLPAGSL